MRTHFLVRAAVLWVGGTLLGAALHVESARADLTIYCHYTFLNGDTLSRVNCYSDKRMRATMSDGNEAIYDAASKEITFVNHARKRYWKGPLSRANAIVDSLTLERDKAFWAAAQDKQQEWFAFVERFNNSIVTRDVDETRKFAAKKCRGVEISAGNSMIHTRWITSDLKIADYTRDIEKILLLPALDPVGRSIGRLIVNSRKEEGGVTLGASTKLDTPTQKGSFSWEAYRLDTRAIPDSVWAIPAGYEKITF